MDPKYKSFEKLLNVLLVPKLNKVFFMYSEFGLRIKNITVTKPDYSLDDYKIDEESEYNEIQLYITYEETNTPLLFFIRRLSYPINHLILNLTSYVFTEDVIMRIVTTKGDIPTDSYYDTKAMRMSDQQAMETFISLLDDEVGKK